MPTSKDFGRPDVSKSFMRTVTGPYKCNGLHEGCVTVNGKAPIPTNDGNCEHYSYSIPSGFDSGQSFFEDSNSSSKINIRIVNVRSNGN
jgi:hypothetical protein